ncbi:hypothetical protein HK098_003134 [Nowakowskiella sp. JEL0407]|nr:hypothetical protein HK098_003134 [Nowakowskiella sp. JEL0407]
MKASGFGNSNGSAASEEVTLRLSKKDNMPVLALTVNGLTRHSHTIKLVQYIPATLLSQDQKEQLKEPLLSDPQVHILLPNLLALKQIADKIKQLHTRLTISANMNGCLSLKTSTIGVDVVVSFKDLANPELDPTQVDVNAHPSRVRDKDAFADVTVDVRDFIKFVQMYSTNPTNVVCCLVEGFGVVFYVYVGKPGGGGGGTLTFCEFFTFH